MPDEKERERDRGGVVDQYGTEIDDRTTNPVMALRYAAVSSFLRTKTEQQRSKYNPKYWQFLSQYVAHRARVVPFGRNCYEKVGKEDAT